MMLVVTYMMLVATNMMLVMTIIMKGAAYTTLLATFEA
jgi:hypothetical protein